MQEELYALLSAALSFPISWEAIPEGAGKQRAYIYRASETVDYSLDVKGLIEARVNVDCYGESYGDAVSASRDVVATLDRYKGGSIRGAFHENSSDLRDEDAGILYRITLTFRVVYAES